jgi:uncharacterized membrane protein (UPF0127 family)
LKSSEPRPARFHSQWDCILQPNAAKRLARLQLYLPTIDDSNADRAGSELAVEKRLRFVHLQAMKFHEVLAVLLIGLAALAGCNKGPAGTVSPPVSDIDPIRGHLLHAQPRLPTIKVWLGDQELKTEIASRPVEIATGMMFRTNMPENEAMIFVFPDAAPRSFYMRNCFVPLSGGYISPQGEILQIIDMKPHDETGIPSDSSNVQFVLEVPQGWFARHNVSTGAVARTERGTLMQTFFRKN